MIIHVLFVLIHYTQNKGTGDLKNVENWTCEEPDLEKY
jgi:hypothetical protein